MIKLSWRQPGDASITPIHQANHQLSTAVDDYLKRYASASSRESTKSQVGYMIRHTGARTAADFTEANLTAWITSPGANNTVRQRISTARGFLKWCHRQGFIGADPTLELDYLTRQYPKTYGKVQGKHPARWLTPAEAEALIGQCRDGTLRGLRDEILLGLGLAGMRAAEIRNLRVGDIYPDQIRWMGKGRKPRHIVPGARLTQAIEAMKAAAKVDGHPLRKADHIINPTECTKSTRGTPRGHRVLWGQVCGAHIVTQIVSTRAAEAGLGHVAPHDLRRSAAGILHHTMSHDGGHRFDLLDIQKVLGHTDPATTMRSYLDPMDTKVQQRAAGVLDF